MSLSLSNSLNFVSVPLWKLEKAANILICQIMNAFFWAIWGSFLTYIDSTTKSSFCERILLTPIISVKNTSNRIFGFSLIFAHLHQNIFISIHFWNDLSKLATFDPILQRPLSTMAGNIICQHPLQIDVKGQFPALPLPHHLNKRIILAIKKS